MIISLLTDEQFLRHVDGLVLTELEKELLGRLKCKIEALSDISSDLSRLDDLIYTLKELAE